MTRPVGPLVEPAAVSPPLKLKPLQGRSVTMRAPDLAADTAALYPLTHGDQSREAVWTYMGYGPFPSVQAMQEWMAGAATSVDPRWYTVTDQSLTPVGMATLMSQDRVARRVEIGNIWYVPEAHGSSVNTEASFLMIDLAFEYYRARRVEWKCDHLNAASRRAALRLGFRFEGIFRNHMVVKGRSRDTAWFSITDSEWIKLKPVLQDWIDHPDPKPSLRALTAPLTGDD